MKNKILFISILLLPLVSLAQSNKNGSDSSSHSGYINYTELFYGDWLSSGDANNNAFGFQTINGYQHKKHYSLGIGVGVSILPPNLFKSSLTFLPIFLDGRLNFNRGKKVRPFIELGIGNSLYLSKQEQGLTNNGGAYLAPTIGASIQLAKMDAIYFGVGFLFQGVNQIANNPALYEEGPEVPDFSYTYFILQLKVGFSF